METGLGQEKKGEKSHCVEEQKNEKEEEQKQWGKTNRRHSVTAMTN